MDKVIFFAKFAVFFVGLLVVGVVSEMCFGMTSKFLDFILGNGAGTPYFLGFVAFLCFYGWGKFEKILEIISDLEAPMKTLRGLLVAFGVVLVGGIGEMWLGIGTGTYVFFSTGSHIFPYIVFLMLTAGVGYIYYSNREN